MLFVATDCSIYAHPYITLNGQNYYNLSGNNEQCQFYMCQKDSPKAKNSVGMQLKEAPLFPGTVVSSTHRQREALPGVTVDVPKALMDFYKRLSPVRLQRLLQCSGQCCHGKPDIIFIGSFCAGTE